MINDLQIINRNKYLFEKDVSNNEVEISKIVEHSDFLVIGGAGSIGQAVVKEIFKRNPNKLHVVDLSENNLVELVRDLRSSIGYIEGEFKTFTLDIGSIEYDAFIESDGKYDYVLNLSALKHVRSEKDPFTLMRMIDVNIFNTEKTIQQSIKAGVKKYFCVSTDKAANPVNMMGASKKIMELFLMKYSRDISISTARFANVAFSDGSLLKGFTNRIEKRQPIAAPNDVKRYFVTSQESGELCLMSCLFGDNRDVFFPKLTEDLDLISLSVIAENYLKSIGYLPYICETEEQARDLVETCAKEKKWPCFFTVSNTTGEKGFEEFYTDNETLDLESYVNLGVIKNNSDYNEELINEFAKGIVSLRQSKIWNKADIVSLFNKILPNFEHIEKGKNLDSKMVMDEFRSIISFIRKTYGTDEFIPLHVPSLNELEKKYLTDCIDSTFVSSVGQYVNQFEAKMSKLTDSKSAIAVVNGTSALHIALYALGVSTGDIVLTQSLTFVATCNAVAYTGGEPAFIDVDYDTMGMCPKSLEKFLISECKLDNGNCIHIGTGKRVKVCMPMHTFGFPCQIHQIVEICKDWNIKVVEDAAESLGSYVKDAHTGSIGDIGVFSFNGNKIITAGGGGCVVTNDDKLGRRIKHLTTTAKEAHQWEYKHMEVGFNYRMPNINAALVCAQLEKLDDFLVNKRDIATSYRDFFKGSRINYRFEKENTKANFWLNTIELRDLKERNAFLEYSNSNGVMTRPVWNLMSSLPMYENCISEDLSISKFLSERIVNLPSSNK